MMIPGMKTSIDVSTEYGVESVVIGMPHRGRYTFLSGERLDPIDIKNSIKNAPYILFKPHFQA